MGKAEKRRYVWRGYTLKRIWIFSQDAMTLKRGTLTRHYTFAQKLIEIGYDVTIFAASFVHNTNMNEIENHSLFYEKNEDGVPFVYVRTASFHKNNVARVRNMLDYYFHLKRTVKHFPKPDVIYASSPQFLTMLAGVQIANRLKVPCITEVRDLWPESLVEYGGMSRKNLAIRCMYRLERYCYIHSDSIIFTMEGMYDYVAEQGWGNRIPKSKCAYINNGVNLEQYRSNALDYEFPDAQLNDPDTFKVIYCGSIRTANHVGALVECADVLKSKGLARKIQFLIFGDGTERRRLEEEAVKRGLDNICFKGFIEKKYIPYILSKGDLNVLNYKVAGTQKYGNSSNKLFEYLASGHPVLANIEEGNYPIISKYQCGIVLRDKSVTAYADAVESFAMMNAEEYDRYCENALKTVQMFDFDVLTKKLVDVIEHCGQELSTITDDAVEEKEAVQSAMIQ